MQKVFPYKSSAVSYQCFGNGEELLFAFHGYNGSAEHFRYFENGLKQRFKVIAIDFFWHGRSEWNEAADFQQSDLQQILTGIAGKEGTEMGHFSVCAYSLGCQLAYSAAKLFPGQLRDMILVSPPPDTFRLLLNFAVNSRIGLGVFRMATKNLWMLKGIIKGLKVIGAFHPGKSAFMLKALDKEGAGKLYKTWYAHRNLLSDLQELKESINEKMIRVILVAGKKDHVTPPTKMIHLVRMLKNQRVFLVRKGHGLRAPQTKKVFEELYE